MRARRVFPGSAVLRTRRRAQRPARRARDEIWPAGECACPTRRCGNRVKLIRGRWPADSIPGPITVPGRLARAPGSALRYRWISVREVGHPITFRRFLPCLDAPPAVRQRRGLRPQAMRLVCCLYDRREIGGCGFGDLAFDSLRDRRAGRHEPRAAVRAPTVAGSTGSIQKYKIKTMACGETSITIACYLCNTLWKRGAVGWFEAVP